MMSVHMRGSYLLGRLLILVPLPGELDADAVGHIADTLHDSQNKRQAIHEYIVLITWVY